MNKYVNNKLLLYIGIESFQKFLIQSAAAFAERIADSISTICVIPPSRSCPSANLEFELK